MRLKICLVSIYKCKNQLKIVENELNSHKVALSDSIQVLQCLVVLHRYHWILNRNVRISKITTEIVRIDLIVISNSQCNVTIFDRILNWYFFSLMLSRFWWYFATNNPLSNYLNDLMVNRKMCQCIEKYFDKIAIIIAYLLYAVLWHY